MPCYKPLKAYQKKGFPSGTPTFFLDEAVSNLKHVTVPCGRCIGCRLSKSRDWAIRCVHESRSHDFNSFITLTYRDADLPPGRSLQSTHHTLFMKRLRRRLERIDPEIKIRYYMCGEYGTDENDINGIGRPHYHYIIFGYNFPDSVFWKRSNTGFDIRISPFLNEVWPYGYTTVQNMTAETAAYVARYTLKKITGEKAVDHYIYVNDDGEIFARMPEFTRMSLKPGIGQDWLLQNYPDIYPKDFVTNDGIKFKAPRYYDSLFEKIDADALESVKIARRLHNLANPIKPKRLERMEEAKLKQAERLLRSGVPND